MSKKDSVLKKQFSGKNLQRARNLVTGKVGDRTTKGVGYNKKYEHHEEGDVWEEGGRTWTIKNGIKQNITKLDKAKKVGKMPLFCPKCGTIMKDWKDKKLYPAYGHCFNCQIDHEAQLRKEGKLMDHLIDTQNQFVEAHIDHFKKFAEDMMAEQGAQHMSETGEDENWSKLSKEQYESMIQETVEYLEQFKYTPPAEEEE
jgi:uncharacterized C2H2 Zn-finger protein